MKQLSLLEVLASDMRLPKKLNEDAKVIPNGRDQTKVNDVGNRLGNTTETGCFYVHEENVLELF
jgi:hypothetical protein